MGRFVMALLGIAVCLGAPGEARAGAKTKLVAAAAGAVSEASSQARRPRRTRIIVYPRTDIPRLVGPRYFGFDVYPRPYPYEWPGPHAKRECVAWLAPEARLSGTVIVPRQRCWWVPG